MYSTSQDYKDAMRSASRPYNTVEGTISLTNGTVITVDGSNMPSNSISISKQCIDDDELMFGGVFANTLKLSILPPDGVSRYDLFGATVELSFFVQIGTENDEPVFEEVPLGIFTVSDADKPNDRVNLTCYDNMMLLGMPLGDVYITGTPWQIFQIVQQNTGMLINFTAEDLEEFPNYDVDISASSDRGLQSYYDVVKEICQMMGCFAYAERNGKLQVKAFSQRPDIALTISSWYSLVPADYQCKYIGLSVSSMAGTWTKYSEDPTAYGLKMVIEDAPAWDYGSAEIQQEKTDALYDCLIHIDEYTPCDIDMPGDPSFDCGDRLQLTARNGDVIETLITSMEWKFHQGMSITSDGINPYLEGSSVLASESNRIINQAVAKSKLQFISFTNSKERVIGDEETMQIGECTFHPTANTNAIFVATILVDIDVADVTVTDTEEVQVPVTPYYNDQETVVTDINGNPVTLLGTANNTYTYERDGKLEVDIFYRLNLTRLPSDEEPYTAIEEIEKGKHIITVAYPINSLLADTNYTFEVFITSKGGTTTVPIRTLQASLIGQELTDTSKFDGKIAVQDYEAVSELYGLGTLALEHGEFVTTINPDPEEHPEFEPLPNQIYIQLAKSIKVILDRLSLYNISSVESKSLQEGSGSLQPQIYLLGGFFFTTEDGSQLSTEDDKYLYTEAHIDTNEGE